MLTVNKYAQILLDEFYLDPQGNIRRSKEGYQGRFSKGDLATFFKGYEDYWYIQVPRVRTTVKRSHLVLLLNGITLPDNYQVDHLDGDRSNDHIDNLRAIPQVINNYNRKKRSDNTSGITGIRWSEAHKHYVIRRTVGGKRISRSRKTLEEAKLVLDELTKLEPTYTDRHGK